MANKESLEHRIEILEKLMENQQDHNKTMHLLNQKLYDITEELLHITEQTNKAVKFNSQLIDYIHRDLLFIYKRLKRLDNCEGECDFEALLKAEKSMKETFGL